MSNNINEAILEALFITEYEKIDKFFPATNEKNNTAYFLTTNALEDKKIKWIAKGKHFTHEGLDERVFGKDEELFIDGSGWVSQNGKHLMYGRTKKPIHIKNLVPELWTIKRRKKEDICQK
jgi:hypothetical protein